MDAPFRIWLLVRHVGSRSFWTGTMLLKPMDEEKEEMVSAGFLINNEEKLKIGKLKAKIISKGLPVRLYRDLHELGEPGSQGLVSCDRETLPTLIIENIDFKHNFERFYHEEFTEKCKEVFVISKESNRTFEILERFALKDVEFDFNNAAAGPSLSILRCNHSRQRERSICLSEPNESQESTSPPNLGQILPKANGFLESVSRAALAHEDEWLLGGFVQPSLKSYICCRKRFSCKDEISRRLKYQEEFGEKNLLVGEIMEFLADLLFFPLRHSERAQAPEAQAQRPWLTGPAAPRNVGSSRTRAQTRVPCIGRRTLNHCATREALFRTL
ncbi:putative tetratricopeptide repeat protein 41 isoform X4 [Orcinus orca]|uniref:putative tetratricopeptide repeat protein 41 isoform X4 n=1 Tax=Orcinus orca TaxID=9733 RepID=UPI002112F76D|nr:putative tetratricopeptide repeat protein 41 isoform X4 [Orcinus orca]